MRLIHFVIVMMLIFTGCVPVQPMGMIQPGVVAVASLPRTQWPECPEHDPSQWHALDNPKQQCHYTHHHGDDPTAPRVQAVFAAVFDDIRATVSFPWATKGSYNGQEVVENRDKHEGYFWLFREFPDPYQDLNWAKPADAIVASLTQVHFHPTHKDGVALVHSYQQWTKHCLLQDGVLTAQCGFIEHGGHAHTGIVHCRYKETRCALPNDPKPVEPDHWIPGVGMDTWGKSIDPYKAYTRDCNEILGKLRQNPDGWRPGGGDFADNNRDNEVRWFTGAGVYGTYNLYSGWAIMISDHVDCFDVDAYNAAATLAEAEQVAHVYLCSKAPLVKPCRFDGSELSAFTIYDYTPEWLDGSQWDTNLDPGRVTIDIFTTPDHNSAENCTAASATCVPWKMKDAFVGWHGFNVANSPWPNGKMPGNWKDYNTSPAGKQWITAFEHKH